MENGFRLVLGFGFPGHRLFFTTSQNRGRNRFLVFVVGDEEDLTSVFDHTLSGFAPDESLSLDLALFFLAGVRDKNRSALGTGTTPSDLISQPAQHIS